MGALVAAVSMEKKKQKAEGAAPKAEAPKPAAKPAPAAKPSEGPASVEANV